MITLPCLIKTTLLKIILSNAKCFTMYTQNDILFLDKNMATINIRVDNDLKAKCERIFDEIGLGMTGALTIFLKAVVRNNGIPFPLEIPNNETLKAFKEVEDISSGKTKAKRYSSVAELRKDLDL